MSKHGALARALLRSAAAPALLRALPLYVAIAMVAAVIFGPSGMSASTVTEAERLSRGFRLGLWAAWLAAVSGPSRTVFQSRESFYLRAFPVGPGFHQAVVGLVLAALQAPWLWLFLRGEGLLSAAAALAMGVALAALFSARPRGLADALAGVLLFFGAGFVLALPAPLWGRMVSGVIASVMLVPAAWRRAPEAGPGWRLVRVRGTWFSALVRTHLLATWRERRPVLGRALIATLVGAGFAALAARANAVSSGQGLAALSLAIGSVSLSVAAGSFAVAAVESERGVRWLLDAVAASGARRAVSSGALVVAFSAVLGGLHGGVVAWGAGAEALSWLRLLGEGSGLGAALSLASLWFARAAERASGVDGARVVAYLVATAVLCAIGFGVVGEICLAVLGAVALALAIRTVDLAAFPARRWGARPGVGG